MEILGLLILWIVIAITASIVASRKGRSRTGWFFLCLLLTPLIILILLALPARGVQRSPAEATKVCPQCAETVKAAAKICHFCRYEFG
jgi:hypothetical protein